MKLHSFRSERQEGRSRISASVTWEDCDLPDRPLFFETEADLAGEWPCRPEAFLLACILPAWRHGESRLAVDAPVCLEVLAGVNAAVDLIAKWWPGRKPVRIEAGKRVSVESDAEATAKGRVAGMFLSGGVDSLATLCMNRRTYPDDDPRAIKIGLFVHGFDLGFEESAPQLGRFEQARQSLQAVCREGGLELIPVSTNIRHLDPDGPFWGRQFHGAALAAVGHAFAHRLSSVTIASGDNIALVPWGSHPALDPLYGSAALQVVHDGMQFTRLEKTAILAEWPTALNHLRVCWESQSGGLNCGRCEKCVRTMLHLLVCGRLAECRVFDANDVTPEKVQDFSQMPVNYNSYRTLVDPLAKLGRHDLVQAIQSQNSAAAFLGKLHRRMRDRTLALDARWLGGSLASAWRAARGIRQERAK